MLIRPARAEDYPAFVPLHHALGDVFAPPSAERWAAEMVPQTVLAEHDGAVVGYCYGSPLAESGHVRHLAVAPDARRLGAGRALLAVMAERFRAAGLRRWHLNVRPDNPPAIALYRAVGMRPRFESVSVRIEWARLEALPAAVGVTGELNPASDATVEPALGFVPGQLSDARARERLVRAVRVDGAVVAAGALDPSLPGVSPVRARTVPDAVTLLRTFAALAPADPPHVNVFAENAPELAEALLGAGGTEALRVVRYEGLLDDLPG